jgi:ribonuclease HI
MPKTKYFYAVHRGRSTGVYATWSACKAQVDGYPKPVYKKFASEAQATTFAAQGWGATRSKPSVSGKASSGSRSPKRGSPKHGSPRATSQSHQSHKSRTKIPAKRAWPLVPRASFAPDITVYTDGGCRKIGKRRVGSCGVYFGPGDARNVSARLDPEANQTNNVAELTAIHKALDVVHSDLEAGKRVLVATDSKYSILCATTFGAKCAPGGIKAGVTTVPNRALVDRLYARVVAADGHVQFRHVYAHTDDVDADSVGNRAADALATEALVGRQS